MAADEKLLQILAKERFDASDIETVLSVSSRADMHAVRRRAEAVTFGSRGPGVYFRGLVEFSNICHCDCFYCGIRKSNRTVTRYSLRHREILDSVRRAADLGYGSIVLQSGERRDSKFIDFVEEIVRSIKTHTRSSLLPQGVGITLCVGEQSLATYERFFAAGAHRYLLRMESSSPELFRRWHPGDQTFEDRLRALEFLRRIGFQVGTGVMIGAPWQTPLDLARDVIFFRDQNVDMIGMGPFIPHPDAPLGKNSHETCPPPKAVFARSLLMISATRLVMPDINIAATTALQTMAPRGREMGIAYGANVIMPLLTPMARRESYQLYQGKPCLDENQHHYRRGLEKRFRALGRQPAYQSWGDSPHFFNRNAFEKGKGGPPYGQSDLRGLG